MRGSILRTVIFFILFAHFWSAQAQFTEKWGDQKDGTYRNPILPADFSDLDAIRVGKDYYAISSTMQYSPGMVVLHSLDMVNWEIIGHVADDLTRISPEMNWDKMNVYGKGIWAGSIRYYKNRFWVYFGTPDDGFFMSSAINPAGPWTPLHQLWKVSGWDDCCSFCDDDGQLYFIATNFALDPKTNTKYNIHLFKMNPDGRSLVMESDTIIHQSHGSEANKLYKMNGLYYHFFSEVKNEGRVIMMERSKSLKGPWEIRQLNHVHGRADMEPNQGGLLQAPDGNWHFLTHHGSGSWEGRAMSLLPVTWLDGWPIIGAVGEDKIGNMVWTATKPIQNKKRLHIQTSDDFSAPNLNTQWEWNYQPRIDKWSLTERKGFLRLYATMPLRPDNPARIILRAANTITQRTMRTDSCTATIKMDVSKMVNGQYAGLTHFSTESESSIGIQMENNQKYLHSRTLNKSDNQNIIKMDGRFVWFRSVWDYQGVNAFFYSFDGQRFVPYGETTSLTWGSYRGDRIGIFNYNTLEDAGFVDVDWMNYQY